MILQCLVLGMMGQSCRKFIEIDPPKNSVDNTGEFINDDQAKTALAGLYAQMMTVSGAKYSNGGSTIYSGLLADELTATLGPQSADDYAFQRNRLQTTNMVVQSLWNSAYQNIYTTNSILDNLPKAPGVTDSLKKELSGEAKFARAFGYFYLTNFFGDVPLALTSDFNQTAKLPRSAQPDVYKQIINDLLDAQKVLPAAFDKSGAQRVIPNQMAANALLARVYLYQKDWKNAEIQASGAINNKDLVLNTSLRNVFLKTSQETIWQLQYVPGGTGSTPPEITGFRPFLVFSEATADDQAAYIDPYVYPTIAPYIIPAYTLRPEIVGQFEAGDQREKAWVGYAKSPDIEPYNGVTTYFPYKYKVFPGAGADPDEYYVLFRLAEQYLIRAEARNEQGDLTGAAADLNKVRSRAGLPNTTANSQSAMRDAIMHERQVELFAEGGHRWFDLKRTGLALKKLGGIPDKTPLSTNALLLPVPQPETIKDPFITQNPGY